MQSLLLRASTVVVLHQCAENGIKLSAPPEIQLTCLAPAGLPKVNLPQAHRWHSHALVAVCFGSKGLTSAQPWLAAVRHSCSTPD